MNNLITEEQSTKPPEIVKTNDEIIDAIKYILKSNDVKIGTKRARTIECAFIQGMMVADNRYARNAFLTICLMSGRSIIDWDK